MWWNRVRMAYGVYLALCNPKMFILKYYRGNLHIFGSIMYTILIILHLLFNYFFYYFAQVYSLIKRGAARRAV